jgi:hypothetical protein
MFEVLLILCRKRQVLIGGKKFMREQNIETLFSVFDL